MIRKSLIPPPAANMAFAFHGTRKRNALSIMAKGLLPRDTREFNHGILNDVGAYVNFTPTVQDWGNWEGRGRWDGDCVTCVVVVNMVGVKFFTDRVIGYTGGAVCCPDGVPPENILGIFDSEDEAMNFVRNLNPLWGESQAELFHQTNAVRRPDMPDNW